MPQPTLFKSPDGEMYLVPPDVLAPYQLSAEEAAVVEAKLSEATSDDDAEVSGYRFDARRPNLTIGSLGLDRFGSLGGNPVAPTMDNSDTLIIVGG